MNPEQKGRQRRQTPGALSSMLAAALLAGIAVAWEPRYWHVAVALVSVALAGCVWAFTARDISLPWQVLLVAPLAVWGFAQIALHSTVVPSMTLRASMVWALCLVAFVLGSQILRRRHELHGFLEIMLWGITGVAACAILQARLEPIRVFGIFPAEPSVVGTMFYKNQFAALMELGAPIALWRALRGKVLAGGVCYAIIFAGTVTSLSRTGTILVIAELLVFLAIVVFGRYAETQRALTLAATLAAMIVAGGLVVGLSDLWVRMSEQNPYEMREKLADSTFQMIAARPWSGFGMGTWRTVFPAYATLDMATLVNEAHNDLAQWGSEGGVAFLLLILALPVCLLPRIIRSIWGIGLVAVLTHCYVDYPMREPAIQLIWFAMAGALAGVEMSRESAAGRVRGVADR